MNFLARLWLCGTINGWNNTSNPMSDDDMDGAMACQYGDLYKFIQNADWGLAESFNGSESCTTPPAEFATCGHCHRSHNA